MMQMHFDMGTADRILHEILLLTDFCDIDSFKEYVYGIDNASDYWIGGIYDAICAIQKLKKSFNGGDEKND